MPRHSLSRAAFREFCAGAADPATVIALIDAEYSRRRLLLRALADDDAAVGRRGVFGDPRPAWDVLATAESRAPDVVRQVILYPPVGVWLHRAVVAAIAGRDVTFADLNRMAAAAAIRSDVPCDLALPVQHGAVVLPTVGSLRLPGSFPAGFARLRHGTAGTVINALDGRLAVTIDPYRVAAGFRPSPIHTTTAAGVELSVWIDDTDPYREFDEARPPHESSSIELLEWRKLLDEAWDTLVHRHPRWAREIGAGVSVVTPAVHNRTSSGFSSAGAIGAIALPAGQSVLELAETLVHEFQHSKLNAVARLVDLVEDDTGGRFYAPWRPDPRPLSGMLHGIYAFVSVAEFWLAQADQVPPSPNGALLLAHRRRQVAWALESMAGSTGLTEAGDELVAAVRHRLRVCLSDPIPAEVTEVAERMVLDHYANWRLRNIRPDAEGIEALTHRWRRGMTAESPRPGLFQLRPRCSTGRSTREGLLRARLSGSGRRTTGTMATAFGADQAYADDDYDTALAGYLRADHDAGDAVVGAGLCLRGIGRQDVAHALLGRPEVVAALVARLGGGADPVAVGTWLAPVVAAGRVGAP
ncbi:MAG TPA: HEXXH motif-containing putative peptide modification protein [Pseudonocardiaceae bacterium]|nr:HEXXH motif-containing putative peptide modification protein [Pseudonocardiaceae bacterium]